MNAKRKVQTDVECRNYRLLLTKGKILHKARGENFRKRELRNLLSQHLQRVLRRVQHRSEKCDDDCFQKYFKSPSFLLRETFTCSSSVSTRYPPSPRTYRTTSLRFTRREFYFFLTLFLGLNGSLLCTSLYTDLAFSEDKRVTSTLLRSIMASEGILSRNNVQLSGKGSQPMLFAHGFGCDQNMWRFVAPGFFEDYNTILLDYVGAGKSDISSYNAERYSSLSGYSQDIIEVCKELNLENVIFVGHSVSCMIGLLAAIERPGLFDKIIMIAPSPCYINDDSYNGGFEREDIVSLLDTMEKNYIGWSNFMAPKIMGNGDRPELTQELETSFCSTDPVIANQFARATFFSDNRKDLANLTVPSLILQCTDDIIAPKEVGEYLADHLQNSTLKMINATGHCPHMSEPAETVRLIKEYLGLLY